ncbi:putative membrane protein (TIGR02226 family) [Tenacibaculum sp. 190524A05c]|uniref:BatA domain-containing protein n=1 Tax=Tenacibaculum platacis TaxID=3137852 RepID=UPI0031FAB409
MQFKHPEFLYFLALLIIPILVHLFQLRKFKKVPFTNVAFLENLVIKNRKSSQIKKWLLLACRLLLISAIVLAFAQPFLSNRSKEVKDHTFIYLDNSMSSNANGNSGNILKNASLELIENNRESGTYTLLTNSNFYRNISSDELKNKLKKITNSPAQISQEEILLKISSLKNTTENIIISDFQNLNPEVFENKNLPLSLVQIIPEQKSNISIDSIYVSQNTSTSLQVNAILKNQGSAKENIPVALYNDDQLLSKQTFSIPENEEKSISFSIEKTNPFKGYLEVNYKDAFAFDNSFYFSLNSNDKINVLAIGDSNDFLSRIYTKDEFNFTNYTLQNTNYNSIEQQQLIILNELEKIPQSLVTSIESFIKNGGHLVIIPNTEIDLNSYNVFFKNLAIGSVTSRKKDSLKITSINFKHPFFKNVFDKQVRNFQYPFVTTSFTSNFSNSSTLISLENNQNFISQITKNDSKIYWFSSPLDKEQSNFTNSPLIVLVFYNIGQGSLQLSELYYRLSKENTIEVNAQLNKDDILSISNTKSSFIPLQQTFQNKVKITTKDQPENTGFYSVSDKETTLQTIAFNHSVSESSLEFPDLLNRFKDSENLKVSKSVKDTLKKIAQKSKVHWLWKWFLGLAIVSLLLEILILKYFKV